MNDPITIERRSTITVRIDPAVHERLIEIAKQKRQSLNTLCCKLLVKACEAEPDAVKVEQLPIAGRANNATA